MPKRLGIQAGFGNTAAEHQAMIEKVQIAEDLSVESVWTGEAWSRDGFIWLTELAVKTERIGLGTAIVNVYSRSAAAIAMAAATIDEVSGGRMILGLGSSGANVIEHWHGVPFKKPLRRLREYVEIINTIVAGRPLNYAGELFHLQRGFTFQSQGFTPARNHIPLYIAAITPTSIHQTAEVADGLIPIYWPKEKFPELAQTVRVAAEGAGRPANAVTIAPLINVSFTDGPDGTDAEQVLQQARQPVAFYIGRMGRFYAEMFQRHGFEAEVAAAQAAWARRDAAGAAAAISDRMLSSTVVVGAVDECAEQLDERRSLGVDLPIIRMPPGSPQQCRQILERLLR